MLVVDVVMSDGLRASAMAAALVMAMAIAMAAVVPMGIALDIRAMAR